MNQEAEMHKKKIKKTAMRIGIKFFVMPSIAEDPQIWG